MSEVKAKPTPGPWVPDPSPCGEMDVSAGIFKNGRYEHSIIGGCGCCGSPTGVDDSAQSNANLEMICEAGTVHHETGMTPRELVARCSAMEAALQHCEQMLMTCEINRVDHEAIEDEALAIIRAALAKHKEI